MDSGEPRPRRRCPPSRSLSAMSGSRACPDTQPGDCSERDDRETQEKRPLLLNAVDGARLPSERADDGADEAGSPGGESSEFVRTPGEERGQGTATAAADDERGGERKSEPAPELNGEAGDGGALPASLGSVEGGGGGGGGGDGTVVTVPPRASGRPNPCGGGADDGAGGSEAEAPSAPTEERIAGEQRGAGLPGGRKKTRKTTAVAANGKKRKPSGKSIASASQFPVEAADGCCISCVLACLFCEFLSMCNALLSCGECEECCCCCCAQACGADACCAGEDGQACCCCDCELAAACCENDECLEVCCGFCAG
ncbi:uncharacterized protein LOC116949421 isoform X2 [Petromyzon marinus]|uniref:uncharacterized protein LOC116949421 isoform X2 n=1 Tax=Petromyzon marinus TaxID=7757 RepID=UPI003F72606A